jgi:hypothetical protein
MALRYAQRVYGYGDCEPPVPPPGMTLLGRYQTFWFAQTASGTIWTSSYKVWRSFCSGAEWPRTKAYAELIEID